MTNDELPASVTGKAAEPTCSKCGQALEPSQAYPDEWVHVESANRKLAQKWGCWAAAVPAAPPVRTYSEAEEVADSLKYIAATAHNAGGAKVFAALSGEFQKVTENAAACEWYGRDMGKHDLVDTVDGYKRCAKCKKEFSAVTPDPIVISSPAHFLPELKSDADHFAEEYRLQHDLPFSMLQHLAWAWLIGKQDERLKGSK